MCALQMYCVGTQWKKVAVGNHLRQFHLYLLILSGLNLIGCVNPDESSGPNQSERQDASLDSNGGAMGGSSVEDGHEGQEGGGQEGGGNDELVFNPPPLEVSIGTYNVKNLFDLVDDPEHIEGEYTPSGRWNVDRYQTRLSLVAKVINEIDADILALQEVESEQVLNDLASVIRDEYGLNYTYSALSNTRDPRGIALGVLSKYPYLRAVDRPISEAIDCTNGESLNGSRPEARPIFEVNFWGNDDQYALTLLINHWKSKASDDFPCRVSEHQKRGGIQLRKLFDQWLQDSPSRGIVILGDFNSTETENPLKDGLGSVVDRNRFRLESDPYNVWGELGVGQGNQSNNATNSTYYYNQQWQRLDHIFVPQNMLGSNGDWSFDSFEVIRPSYLFRNGRPFSWQIDEAEGYSDHLPLKMKLRYQSVQ